MLNRKLLLVSAVLASSLVLSACDSGSKSKAMLYDNSCLIGQGDIIKANQYIGKLKSAVTKAGIIALNVNDQDVILNYTSKTKFNLGDAEKISDVDKGRCVAVDFSASEDREVARNVSLLKIIETPADLLIGTGEVAEGMASGEVVVFDARTKAAWQSGMIPDAISVPLSTLDDSEGFAPLEKFVGKTLAFYCEDAMCASAAGAAKLAKDAGFRKVKVLEGGLKAWQQDENFSEVHPAYIAKRQDAGKDTLIIDIRPNASIGHAPGAIAIRPEQLGDFEDKFPEDTSNSKVFVYSSSTDQKGAEAFAKEIVGLGFFQVYVVQGGWENLKEFGNVRNKALAKAITYKGELADGALTAGEFYSIVSAQLPPGASFIDVREQDEIAADPAIALIKGENIPLTEIQDKVATLDARKTYYFVCPSTGVRAGIAYKFAKKNGLNAYYINAGVRTDGAGGLTFGEDYALDAAKIKELTGSGAAKANVILESAPEAEGC